MPESFEAWWATLGRVTKAVLVIGFSLTFLSSMELVHPMFFTINFSDMIYRLELWRPVTASFFLGNFGFKWLIHFANLIYYLKRMEEDDYAGRTADLVFMLAFEIFVLHIVAFFTGMPIVSLGLIMALIWIWCKTHEEAVLTIYFFSFKAKYFPWALMLFHMIIKESIFNDIVGIVCGHIYIYLTKIHPAIYDGQQLIWTPQFLRNIFPDERLGPYTVHQPATRQGPAQDAAQQRAQFFTGTGRTLGTT